MIKNDQICAKLDSSKISSVSPTHFVSLTSNFGINMDTSTNFSNLRNISDSIHLELNMKTGNYFLIEYFSHKYVKSYRDTLQKKACKNICMNFQHARLNEMQTRTFITFRNLTLCPKLQVLDVIGDENSKLARLLLNPLIRSLKYFFSLKCLRIDFGKSKTVVNDEEISSILRAHKGSLFLSEILIKFAYCQDLTDHGIKKFAKCLESLNFLNYLHLSLSKMDKITKEGCKYLNSSIKNLSLIDYVSNLQYTNLMSSGISYSVLDIEEMWALETLDVIFHSHNLWEGGINHIYESRENLTSLENLKIKTYNCRPDLVKSFSELPKILEEFSNLEILEICFLFQAREYDDHLDFDGKSLNESMISLEKLQNLKKVKLKDHIFEEEFLLFSKSIENISGIKDLSLNFSSAHSNLRDKSVDILGGIIEGLDLKRLELNLTN